jgi:hypothetical protein
VVFLVLQGVFEKTGVRTWFFCGQCVVNWVVNVDWKRHVFER